MNILFSNPPWWTKKKSKHTDEYLLAMGVRAGSRWPNTFICRSRPGNRDLRDYAPFPHFLAAACTYTKKLIKNSKVFFRDSIALSDSYDDFFKYLKEKEIEFLVIESQSPSWEHDLNLITKINARMPLIKIILTGPIVNSLGGKNLKDLGVYSACLGEYDKTVAKAINSEGKIVGYDLLTREEMNNAPFPYNDQEHYNLYCDNTPIKPEYPMYWMWTSRGCPYKCSFCVWPASMTNDDVDGSQKRIVRKYSSDYIKDQLKNNTRKFDYKTIFVDDDTFNLGNNHTIEMSKVFGEIGLPWNALVRADTIKMETWDVMKENGCYAVRIGFESGNQELIDTVINKKLNLDKAAEVVKYLNKIKILPHGTFTIGHLNETKEQMEQTIKYARNIGLYSYQCAGVGILDGSPLGKFIKENKMTLDENDILIESDADTKARDLGFDISYKNTPLISQQ